MSDLKNKTAELKKHIEELQMQLNLGKMEMEDQWERQKASLKQWAETNMNEISDTSEAWRAKLHERFNNVRQQATMAKARSEGELRHQKDNMAKAIQEVEGELESIEDMGSDKWNDLKEYYQRSSEVLKTKLEVLRYEYTLGKAEARDEWDEFKEKLKGKTEEWKRDFNEERHEAKGVWKHFKSEIGESFGHLKKAFKPKEQESA